MVEKRQSRRDSVSGHKRELILDAAKQIFAAEGLEGASLRAIAVRAGYTPAALYFHFESKEAIYAEVLKASLASLGGAVDQAVAQTRTAAQRLKAAAMARGLMIYPSSGCADGILGDHALLAPPYIVSAADVEMIVERFAQAVDDAIAQAGV